MTRRWARRRHFARDWNGLAIIGYEHDSPYDEDHARIDQILARGRVHGWWWSSQCTDGEIGSADLGDLREISREEFDRLFAEGKYTTDNVDASV